MFSVLYKLVDEKFNEKGGPAKDAKASKREKEKEKGNSKFEGARLSADGTRLRDGEVEEEISLEEARRIAAAVGEPVPPPG